MCTLQDCPLEEKLASGKGYSFAAKFDSPGHGIVQVKGDINAIADVSIHTNVVRLYVSNGDSDSQLPQVCNAKSDCEGFNTDGWVKSSILPEYKWIHSSKWTCTGLYVR